MQIKTHREELRQSPNSSLLFENEVIEQITEVKKSNPLSKVVSSVRDIIESNGGGEKDEYISELINKWYDLILVHGDERMADLSFSFSKGTGK